MTFSLLKNFMQSDALAVLRKQLITVTFLIFVYIQGIMQKYTISVLVN